MDKKAVMALASDLVENGENKEYTRGISELIAYMFPVEGETPSDRVEEITAQLIA